MESKTILPFLILLYASLIWGCAQPKENTTGTTPVNDEDVRDLDAVPKKGGDEDSADDSKDMEDDEDTADAGDDEQPEAPGGACLKGSGDDYTKTGPYKTAQMEVSGGYSVFYPADMDEECKHPIVAWGNGTSVIGSAIYAHHNQFLASYGIVVIAAHTAMAGSGLELRNGLKWLETENNTAGSKFYKKLSDKSGVSGHSQGGMGAAVAAGADKNIDAAVIIQGGGFGVVQPTLWLTGTSDIMNGGGALGFSSSKGPAFLASLEGADHFATPTLAGALSQGSVQYKRVTTAWFRCFLADDDNACKLFKEPACKLCNERQWVGPKSKNL